MIKNNVKYRPHQAAVLPRVVESDSYALFHDMGRGKTLTAIAAVWEKSERGEVNAHLVVPLTSIKSVWVEQYAQFSEEGSYDIFVMAAGRNKAAQQWINTPSDKLKVFVVGIESLSQGAAYDFATDFVKKYQTHITVDESTSIKNAGAARTKRMNRLGRGAVSRLILTGTPNPNGVEDLYAQFFFLEPTIIGLKSFFAFKCRYCIMGGFEGRKVIGYQNEDHLWELLRPHCDVVEVDASVMPDRSWIRVDVPVTPEQKRIIRDLEDSFGATLEGKMLSTETILERLTRFQQVLGGSFPYEDEQATERGNYIVEDLAKIPKLDILIEQIGLMPTDAKVIIWARFLPEIRRIVERLEKENLGKVVQFHGLISDEQRAEATKEFQHGGARFMITNSAGARGQTWTAARYAVFYSNSYSYEIREQAERRNWGRDDTGHDVVYLDLVSESKYDETILRAIRYKKDLADLIKDELASC